MFEACTQHFDSGEFLSHSQRLPWSLPTSRSTNGRIVPMFKSFRRCAGLAGLAAAGIFLASTAAAEVKIRVQAAVPTKAD